MLCTICKQREATQTVFSQDCCEDSICCRGAESKAEFLGSPIKSYDYRVPSSGNRWVRRKPPLDQLDDDLD